MTMMASCTAQEFKLVKLDTIGTMDLRFFHACCCVLPAHACAYTQTCVLHLFRSHDSCTLCFWQSAT